MAKEMKSAYEMTPNGENTRGHPIVQSQPILSGQSSNGGTVMSMGVRSSMSAALDAAIEHEIRMGTIDPNMDRKSMRRIISNRYAAKKSHNKKLDKINELEKTKKDLENTIATLQPQVEAEQQLRSRLRVENEILTRQLQDRIDLSNIREAEIAERSSERQWLRGLLDMQMPQQLDNGGTDDVFDLLDFNIP